MRIRGTRRDFTNVSDRTFVLHRLVARGYFTLPFFPFDSTVYRRPTILIAALISRNGWAVSITGNAISVVINSFSKLIVIIDRFGGIIGSNGINTDLVPFATSNLAKFELRRKDRKPLRWNGILDLFYLKVANLVSFRLLVRRGADGIRRE